MLAYGRKKTDRDGEVHSTLYLSHYESICKYGQNWEIFKDVISLDEKDKKNKNKNTKWMREINNFRQITAHPERGPPKQDSSLQSQRNL